MIPKKKTSVMMLVTNPCINDSRVIKSAETLARQGYKVYVICREAPDFAAAETRNGVFYERIPMVFGLLPGGVKQDKFTFKYKAEPGLSTGRQGADHAVNNYTLRHSPWSFVLLLCYVPAMLIFISHKLVGPVLRRLQARWEQNHGIYNDSNNSFYGKILHYDYDSINSIARILFYLIRRPVVRALRLMKKLCKLLAGKAGQGLRLTGLRLTGNLKPVRVLKTSSLTGVATQIKPDVIHAHDFATLPASVRLASITGASVVYDSHELEAHRNGTGMLGRIQVGNLEKHYIRKVTAVITVCDSIADHLAGEYGIAKPTVVMNAPDVGDNSYSGESLRKDIGLPDDIPLAIYVGKITTGRGLAELVGAMSYSPEFHVAMLGPSVAAIEQQLVDTAVSIGVRERLHIVPPVSPGIVMSYIRSADIGVIPIQDICLSYRYCMPNKLFEMAFSGIPACVSNLPEMKAFIERECVGISMDQTDPRDIARAMTELYRRRDEFIVDESRLSELYRVYSWQAQGEKLKGLYQTVLDKRSLPV